MKRKKKTLRPSTRKGVIWPGTIQSGPAASTSASAAKPVPMGLGCFMTETA